MSEIIPLHRTEPVEVYGSQNSTYSQAVWNDTIGRRSYELSNHLGNVLSVISDVVLPVDSNSDSIVDHYLVSIRSVTDYSPFGVRLENRNFLKSGLAEDYRMGFQGQEEDDDVKGEGNSVNYKYRMHDSRLGRFFSTDPLKDSYSELSTYQFASNSPIFMLELEGLEGKIAVTTKWYTNKGIEKSKTQYYTVDGLKADLIKICWKPFGNPKGPVIEIDYYGRMEDGTRSGNSLNNVNPDAKPTVAELNAFFASDPNNSYNIKKVEKARASAEKIEAAFDNSFGGIIYNNILADGALEGGDDGANSGGEYGGVKGMYVAADDLDNVGDVLSYIPTPPTQLLGAIFSAEADGLRTIADYNSLDAGTATTNLGVRLITFGLDKKIGVDIKKAGFDKPKEYISDQFKRKTLDQIKEKSTVTP